MKPTAKISNSTNELLGLCALLFFACILLLLNLNDYALRIYDEARRAVNAFEMWDSKRWLVTTYEYKPDMWGTKPPLLIWCQALMIEMLGPTKLAVRLPSALAGLATVSLLFVFSYKKIGRWPAGLLASFALLTASGYLKTKHSVRSGDFDALLVCWCAYYLIAFFCYIETGRMRSLIRYRLWSAACCVDQKRGWFAVSTRSFAISHYTVKALGAPGESSLLHQYASMFVRGSKVLPSKRTGESWFSTSSLAK